VHPARPVSLGSGYSPGRQPAPGQGLLAWSIHQRLHVNESQEPEAIAALPAGRLTVLDAWLYVQPDESFYGLVVEVVPEKGRSVGPSSRSFARLLTGVSRAKVA
jgi:hypothetical protein